MLPEKNACRIIPFLKPLTLKPMTPGLAIPVAAQHLAAIFS